MEKDDLEKCIDTDYLDVNIARKHCPKNYHIEFTRRGWVIYVLDGYWYDYENDLCYKVK